MLHAIRNIHTRIRSEDGQAIVEFALVLPLLLVVLVGILEFARVFNYWMDTTHLANQAARFAAVDRNPGSGSTLGASIVSQGVTRELRSGSRSFDAMRVCVSFPAGSSNVGDPVKVDVTSAYHPLRILGLGAASIPIRGSATMRLEKTPTVATGGCS